MLMAESSERPDSFIQTTETSAEARPQENGLEPYVSDVMAFVHKHQRTAYEAGVEEGIRVTKINTVLAMTERRFDVKLIGELLALSMTEVEEIIHKYVGAREKEYAGLWRTIALALHKRDYPIEMITSSLNLSVTELEAIVAEAATAQANGDKAPS